MTSITIRKLPAGTKERLRVRAAAHGHSMEAEARAILQTALDMSTPPQVSPTEVVREFFGPEHGVDLELPRREPERPAPTFD